MSTSIALESADLPAESDAAEASDRGFTTEATGATLWTDLAAFPLSERTEAVAAEHNSTTQFTWGAQRLLDGRGAGPRRSRRLVGGAVSQLTPRWAR